MKTMSKTEVLKKTNFYKINGAWYTLPLGNSKSFKITKDSDGYMYVYKWNDRLKSFFGVKKTNDSDSFSEAYDYFFTLADCIAHLNKVK